MDHSRATVTEARLALRFMCVSLVGFCTDALVLHIGVASGLEPAWARVISLVLAMQVTFFLNATLVFSERRRSGWATQWVSYLLTNGFGNVCNYWIFVTLVSTHWPIISNNFFALSVGAFCAWVMNFASARLLVFRRSGARDAAGPDTASEQPNLLPPQC